MAHPGFKRKFRVLPQIRVKPGCRITKALATILPPVPGSLFEIAAREAILAGFGTPAELARITVLHFPGEK